MKEPVFLICKSKKIISWNAQEDYILLSLISTNSKNSWMAVAEKLPGKSPYHCFLRYRSIRPGLKKGSWTPEEDIKIKAGVETYGKKWFLIAKKLFTNRNAKQIRDRYINYLDPNIKTGKFCLEEDQKIIQLFDKYGNKWSIIQQHISDRSADAIKNRYNSSLRKKRKNIVCNIISEEVSIAAYINNYLYSFFNFLIF